MRMQRLSLLLLTFVFFNLADAQIHINLSNIKGWEGDTVTVPIMIDTVSGFNVLAYQFVMHFDSRVISAIDAVTDQTLSAQTSWTTMLNSYSDSIRFGAFGAYALNGGGTLIKLRFLVKGAPGVVSPLTFTSTLLNAGLPGSIWSTGVFTVEESPRISVNLNMLNFGQCALKDSIVAPIVINNLSTSPVTISSVSAGAPSFVVRQPLSAAIKGHDSVSVQVVFMPSRFGDVVDTLTIASNGGVKKVALAGSSPYPAISIKGTFDFGSQKKGQTVSKQFKITNNSINQLVIDTIVTRNGAFAVSGLNFPALAKISDSISFTMKFTPDSVRSYTDTIYIYNNSNVSPLKSLLTGTGTSLTGLAHLEDRAPAAFSLAQNYPNPFNSSTVISFTIPEASFVTLKIFNVVGQTISVLVCQTLPSGNYMHHWNADGYPSGLYFYKLDAGSYTETKRLILLR
jgi:hypothetical protein